ncbi:hypothetical protein A9Q94_02600 [Rhodobacterales bacterium 56_14_T64]|nr:hypothetical protein A9Q94_02600 [Rhodobacterales bacterium 56_14_T64]
MRTENILPRNFRNTEFSHSLGPPLPLLLNTSNGSFQQISDTLSNAGSDESEHSGCLTELAFTHTFQAIIAASQARAFQALKACNEAALQAGMWGYYG